MLRKLILAVATFALVCIAFMIYAWRDDSMMPQTRRGQSVPELRPPELRPVESQPAAGEGKAISFRWAKIPPGQAPKVHVYDPESGEARIIFQAAKWEAASETEFHLIEPAARVLLPGGQLAYVRADTGQVKVQSGDNNNLNPKSGWFSGNVQIFVDRSKPDWRAEHPDKVHPEQHPETVVRIWLDDARFDLDLARLESDGPIRVESTQGSIEGEGLELIWNEVDRKVRLLRILKGRRAVIRGGQADKFTVLPGEVEVVDDAAAGPISPLTQVTAPVAAPAATVEPVESPAGPAPETVSADDPETITFLDADGKRTKPRKDRVDTYHMVFEKDILARQKVGLRVEGWMKADVLRLLCDLGREERSAVEHVPASQPTTSVAEAATSAPATMAAKDLEKEKSSLELLWTGELRIEPEVGTETQPADGPPDRRFQLAAEGNPIELHDANQGDLRCRKLAYHLESKKLWLSGTPEMPVRLSTGAQRQITVEKELFFDEKAGVARMTGAGTMVNKKAGKSDELDTSGEDGWLGAISGSSDVELAWKDGGKIEFDLATVKRAKPVEGKPDTRKVPYLKNAVFDGQVTAGLSDRSVSANHVEVLFLAPTGEDQPKTESSDNDLLANVAVKHITATGQVSMRQEPPRAAAGRWDRKTDVVTCDRLEIDMTQDETGANVPTTGRAFGQVVARQSEQPYLGSMPLGKPLVREIKASKELTIHMASIPRKIDEAEIDRLKNQAREKGYTPDSPEWQAKERELRSRREIVVKRMVATGDVTCRDEKEELRDLSGRTLECMFDDQGQFTRTLVTGLPDEPAQVDHGMFYIRGERLSLDMTTESVEVPGKGMLRFYSDQDIDGEAVDEAIPVVVTWETRMWMRGAENVGTFAGQVRASSKNNMLEARELRLRFENEEPASRPAGSEGSMVGAIVDRLRPEKDKPAGRRLSGRIRKRLARVDAFGDAVIVSSAYGAFDEPGITVVDRALQDLVPESWKTPASQPTEDSPRRLVSRIRLTGPQMRIDLVKEQLLVEGAGNLLVEDYRLPKAQGTAGRNSSTFLASSAVPGLKNLGPSHTLFTWKNAMTFLSDKNIAKFDNGVEMRHRAGAEMVLAKRLESALRLNDATRRRLTNRAASLTCDNLLAEFESNRDSKDKGSSSPLSRATGLKAFWARGGVYLADREGKVQRSASASLIAYDGQNGDAEIVGTGRQPAVIQEVDSSTGGFKVNWRGEKAVWNLKDGTIRTSQSRILAPGG